jgi:hypothetical protein
MGHVDRSFENSERGSAALTRAKGKFRATAPVMVLANWGFRAKLEAPGNDLGRREFGTQQLTAGKKKKKEKKNCVQCTAQRTYACET